MEVEQHPRVVNLEEQSSRLQAHDGLSGCEDDDDGVDCGAGRGTSDGGGERQSRDGDGGGGGGGAASTMSTALRCFCPKAPLTAQYFFCSVAFRVYIKPKHHRAGP